MRRWHASSRPLPGNASSYRIWLSPGDAKTPAILIGGALDQDLAGATQAIENDPGISCKALPSWKITCMLFDGAVTVSPMLEIFINGARSYVPIGSKLQFILPHVTTSERATLIQTLRVERSVSGQGHLGATAP